MSNSVSKVQMSLVNIPGYLLLKITNSGCCSGSWVATKSQSQVQLKPLFPQLQQSGHCRICTKSLASGYRNPPAKNMENKKHVFWIHLPTQEKHNESLQEMYRNTVTSFASRKKLRAGATLVPCFRSARPSSFSIAHGHTQCHIFTSEITRFLPHQIGKLWEEPGEIFSESRISEKLLMTINKAYSLKRSRWWGTARKTTNSTLHVHRLNKHHLPVLVNITSGQIRLLQPVRTPQASTSAAWDQPFVAKQFTFSAVKERILCRLQAQKWDRSSKYPVCAYCVCT